MEWNMRMLWNLLEGEACIDFQFRKKSTMCRCTLALCTALFDAYFWRPHNKGRLVRSRLWQCEQNSDLANYFWQLICLLPKSLPFTKRRLESLKVEVKFEVSMWNVPSSLINFQFLMLRCWGKFSSGTTWKVVFYLPVN